MVIAVFPNRALPHLLFREKKTNQIFFEAIAIYACVYIPIEPIKDTYYKRHLLHKTVLIEVDAFY